MAKPTYAELEKLLKEGKIDKGFMHTVAKKLGIRSPHHIPEKERKAKHRTNILATTKKRKEKGKERIKGK